MFGRPIQFSSSHLLALVETGFFPPGGDMADRGGAAVSDKTIAKAAIEERKVRFLLVSTSKELSGYLAGCDDFHWKIVTPSLDPDVMLIHKSTVVVIIPVDGTRLTDENMLIQDKLRPIITPFRRAMEARQKPDPGERTAP